jgi:hypothetical protein
VAHLHIPQWGVDDGISADQAEQMQQDLAVELEAWSMEGICHYGKHLPHQLCIVGLVKLRRELTACKGLEHILQRQPSNSQGSRQAAEAAAAGQLTRPH